ncbi:MAG: amidohydrolase [Chloroflexi bacterium]|nr:amidohydrolase [Chloroflexota bacterium]
MTDAIDIWCNLFTPEAVRHYWFETEEIRQVISWWRMEERIKGYPIPQFLSLLDEAGVEKVLIPAVKMRSYRTGEMLWDMTAEEVASVVAQGQGRFHGLMGINPWRRMEGVREVEIAVKEYGFGGAHLHPYGFGLPVNHRFYFPFYAKCAELDVPVQIQVGHSAEMMPSAVARPIFLDDIALYFPTLKLIGAHTGWPWVEEMLAIAWKHPNVYVGTSMHAPRYWDPSLVRFINTRGADKVLFGTDFPGLQHKETLAQVEALGLREESKKKILRDNALRVYNL